MRYRPKFQTLESRLPLAFVGAPTIDGDASLGNIQEEYFTLDIDYSKSAAVQSVNDNTVTDREYILAKFEHNFDDAVIVHLIVEVDSFNYSPASRFAEFSSGGTRGSGSIGVDIYELDDRGQIIPFRPTLDPILGRRGYPNRPTDVDEAFSLEEPVFEQSYTYLEPGRYLFELVGAAAAHAGKRNGDAQSVQISGSVFGSIGKTNRVPDTNRDTKVTAFDALLIINELDKNPDPEIGDDRTRLRFDVSGDERVTAFDALTVINAIVRNSATDGALAEMFPLDTENEHSSDEQESYELLESSLF